MGAAPPRPHPERRAAPAADRALNACADLPVNRRAPGPEGARAPLSVIPAKAGIHPGHRRGSGARRTTSLRGRTARLLRGAAPPTPPSRTSTLRGSGPPTRPRMFLHVGAAPPRPHPERRAAPPPDRIAPPTPEAGPAPSPLAGEGGGEGSAAPRAAGRSPEATTNPRGRTRAPRRIGQAPAGDSPQPTRHNPPPAPAAPRRPKWIVEGGCGGEPPLGKLDGSPLVRYNRRGEDRGRDAPALTRWRSSALLHMCRASPLGRRCASPPVSRASPARRRRQAGTGGEAGFQRSAPRGFPPHKGRPRAAFAAFSSSGGASTATRPFAAGSPSQGGQSE